LHLRSDERRVIGWECNLEEDDNVLFKFVITNHGPNKVRAVHCQPLCSGVWRVLQQFDEVAVVSGKVLKSNWRACNDSNFFFIEINSTGNEWVPMSADNDHLSEARTDTEDKTAHMEWHSPQEVHFEVQGHRGDMRVQC